MSESTAALAKRLGIPATRVFDGKKYTLASTPRSKREAQSGIKATRGLGIGKSSRSVEIKGGKYVIYTQW